MEFIGLGLVAIIAIGVYFVQSSKKSDERPRKISGVC